MKLPPLVEPNAELTSDEISRYSRHLLIPEFGLEGQQRLKASKVLVIGAGGLGSPTLLYLAAAGIGTLGIVEFDNVEESNLQRQIIHSVENIGQAKIHSAADSIRQLNPYVELQLHTERLTKENVRDVFATYDLIVDGTDNFATRYLVNDACVLMNKPYIWGSIFRFEGQASVFWENAPNDAGVNYRDLYPEPPPPQYAPSCSEGGVLGIICASIGSVMTTEAIKLITGIGDSLLGRLLTYNALDMHYRIMPLRRAPDRASITELIDYEFLCGLHKAPNDTPENTVPSIEPIQLKAEKDKKPSLILIDVRETTEWNIVHINGALHLPKQSILNDGLPDNIAKDADIVVYCKSGIRSRDTLLALQHQGFHNVKNLHGGIIAWINDVDTSLPTY